MNVAWSNLHGGLQSVLDTALDAVIVMDTDGIVRGWNAHAEQCFGHPARDAIGSRLSELIIPETLRAAHETGLRHFLATGEGPVLNRRIEVTGLHRDGREFPVELSITASDQFGDRLFVGFVRDISDRHEERERQLRLLQESDHRVRNMLTVVSAIAQQTLRGSTDLDSFESAFGGRLAALARSHEMLTTAAEADVPLSALAEQVLAADVEAGRAHFSGPEVRLGPRQVLGLSMILHELYTNSIKYGALCTEHGRLTLEWREADGQVEMVWEEIGESCTPPGSRSGFGARMIALTAKSELNGSVDRDWRPTGLVLTLRFPARR